MALVDAIALGHDCGHGPGGHASEDAFDAFIPEGYDHGPWGADVVLAPLNLCSETLDGIRNHSWSRPAPATIEGEIVSWADRIAYCAHDLEDAIHAGILTEADVPTEVADVCGRTRRQQLRAFVRGVIRAVDRYGEVGLEAEQASALAALRAFNYERIYVRPASLAQSRAVVEVLRALVEFYVAHPASHAVPVRLRARVGRPGPRRGGVRGRDDRPVRLRPRRGRARLGPGTAASGQLTRDGDGRSPGARSAARQGVLLDETGQGRGEVAGIVELQEVGGSWQHVRLDIRNVGQHELVGLARYR